VFLEAGARFFSWNSGKNTPNILIQLSERVEKLNDATKNAAEVLGQLNASVKAADQSSTRLATALNRLTFWMALIAGAGVLVALATLVFQIVTR
jgi:hypothetical protein